MKALFITLGLAAAAQAADGPAFRVHGQAWADFGRIMQVSDTLMNSSDSTVIKALNLSGNGLQGMGAQFTVLADFADHWQGAFGFGAQKVNQALGTGSTSYLSIALFQSFLTESRLTYYAGEQAHPSLSVTVGNFSHKYQPDAKNLGLYLLRGPVYPGALMGGFQDANTDPTRGTLLGAHAHNAIGNFSHDLILNSERDIPPTLDWSLAYLAQYRAFGALTVGAGVNFYRLIPYDKTLQTPGHMSDTNVFKKSIYIEVDPANPGDTVFFTHQGTKLDAYFSLDLKPLFGLQSAHPNDLKLYGEAAVLGIKNYGKAYDAISERIPVMAGFNFPTFGLLDLFSVEVEWYGSPHRNDLTNVGLNNVVADWTRHEHRMVPSPKPASYTDYGISSQGLYVNGNGDTVSVKGTPMDKENLTSDNLKWSLNLEKVVSGHVRFQGQVANDHYRPLPIATGLIFSNGGTAEALTAASDWYFMLRMGYYF